MGLLDSLKGKKETLPALESGSTAAERLAAHRREIEQLAGQTKDRLEAVPSDQALYVYVGKPPKQFGLVWYRDGEEHNLMTFMKQKGLTPGDIQRLSDELRDAYEASRAAQRYSSPVDGRELVVTPDDSLAEAVERIIHEAGA